MEIKIVSRRWIQCYTFAPKTALISVTDVGDDPVKLRNQPEYLLRLAFDDVDNDIFLDEYGKSVSKSERKALAEKYHRITGAQAREIAEFYRSIEGKAELLLCQCEYGSSRSAAIAAAIMEHRDRNGIRVFADDRHCPNKVVFRAVLDQLRGAK